MDPYESIWIGMVLATYALPFAIGLFASNLRVAGMLAATSFCGLYASVWSALGPLFLPLVGTLISQFELATVLILSLLVGVLQAAFLAALGFGLKRLAIRLRQRVAHLSTAQSVP